MPSCTAACRPWPAAAPTCRPTQRARRPPPAAPPPKRRTLPHVSLNEVLKVHPPIARDFAACLRILETPLPFVYLSHLRAFIALWLGVLPWFFVANLRWWTMLLCLIISWGVLGERSDVGCGG
jgi:hypothetical protein